MEYWNNMSNNEIRLTSIDSESSQNEPLLHGWRSCDLCVRRGFKYPRSRLSGRTFVVTQFRNPSTQLIVSPHRYILSQKLEMQFFFPLFRLKFQIPTQSI